MTPPASTAASSLAPPITTTTGRAEPMLVMEPKKRWENVALALFIGVPFIALVAAVPVAWGWGLSWLDVLIAVVMYLVSGHG
ncbi:MAG: acyl-CoA desaturase, partial [Kineosporiaceae bacterium]